MMKSIMIKTQKWIKKKTKMKNKRNHELVMHTCNYYKSIGYLFYFLDRLDYD